MHCIFNIFESAGGLGIGNFRCVTEIYKGGWLPWQPNFGFHSQNCTKLAIIPIICTTLSFFSAIVVFSWLVISNSLPKFSRDVAMATRLMNLFYKFCKNSSRMQCIFNIFKSAGGLAIVDFSYVTEIYKGGCHSN